MRKFSLQTVLGVIVMVFVVVLPLETSAQICFSGSPGTFVIEVAATVGPFISLVGEVILPNSSTPIMATAFLTPDAVAHIAGTVPANPGNNDAFTFDGTLNPPSYNTGSAIFQRLTGAEDTTEVFFGPTACPSLPQ